MVQRSRRRVLRSSLAFALIAMLSTTVSAEDASQSKALGLGPDFEKGNFRKLPTNITSNSLSVESEKHIFTYAGNVVVKQGDMTLTTDLLEGHYDENNQIQQLIATKNVVIVKGDKIRATAQKGVYTAKDALVTLTENPALEQNGSTLAADIIKIFLDEDRSEAEGQVRVTLAPKKDGTPAPEGSIVPTVAPATPTPIPGVAILGQGR